MINLTEGDPFNDLADEQAGEAWNLNLRKLKLQVLSRDIFRTLVMRADDPMTGHVAGYASRAVVLAEALLVEQEKAFAGTALTEEMNMVQGTLFQAFRTENAVKREEP